MRDRLIELMRQAENKYLNLLEFEKDILADYLLKNGVIVPPVKIGDTVYYITGIHKNIVKSAKVDEIYRGNSEFVYHVGSDYVYFDLYEDEMFLTEEEAVRALKGGAE